MLLLVTTEAGKFQGVLAEALPDVNITILHTNDLHGRVEEGIGFARLATWVQNFREENPHTLLLDAGDTVHGLPIATLFQGESIIRLMNAVGYDAMVAGNHDFNYGWERLVALDQMANFPIMGANIINEAGETILTPYEIKEVGGVKIGIFSLSTPETALKTHPKNVAGLTFTDPVTVATEMVNLLEPQVDLIIALGHLGTDQESEPYTSIQVIQAVPGIDLFVDGHCHTEFSSGMLINETLLVSTGEHGNNLGVVQLVVEEGGLVAAEASLINATEMSVAEDEGVKAMIAQLNQEVQTIGAEVIGNTSVHLEGARDLVRTSETNLGNLVTDVFLDVTGADIALTNGGGIRDSIAAGAITKGDIIRVFPFGNSIEVKRVTGQDIKEALEHGTRTYPEPSGAFPQVAGLTFVIDVSRPEGDRVVEVMVGSEPLDLEKEYTLATNDFVAAGGDGYHMIATTPTLHQMMTMDEALIEYIRERGELTPVVEGRITVRDGLLEPSPEPIPEPDPDSEPQPQPKPTPEPGSDPQPELEATPEPDLDPELETVQILPDRLPDTGQGARIIMPIIGIILILIGIVLYLKRKNKKED